MPAMEVDQENAAISNSSTPPTPGSSSKTGKGISADDNREAFSTDLLRLYYAKLFPYEQVGAVARVMDCSNKTGVFFVRVQFAKR